MATLAFGADIPPELISIILSHIHSRKHLVRISLVSRAWQRLAFPALWHEVQITAPPHMEQLVSQLQSEPNDRGHCISQHLNLLFVRLITDLDGDLLARFQQIIPKMAFLKHLTWEDGSPNAVPVLRTFQQSCGALRSVDLDLRRAEPTGDQESVVFGFRNLTHIILPAGMLDDEFAPPSVDSIVQMIQDSPNLVALGVRFTMPFGFDEGDRQPDDFFQSLDRTFPALRELHILQTFLIDWVGFFNYTSPLYRFLERHPGLRAVTFGLDCSDQPQAHAIDTAKPTFDRLLPSLRVFRGVTALCLQVVTSSKLSQQIRKINLMNSLFPIIPVPPTNIQVLSQAVSWLPKLQAFKYSIPNNYDGLGSADLHALRKILEASPSLTSLCIPFGSMDGSNNLFDLLGPLKHAQRLSKLRLDFRLANNDPQPLALREFAYRAATVCPRFSRLKISPYDGGYQRLEIRRLPDGSIQVA